MKKDVWTEEKIKAGFERFFREHGRIPRSHEIDTLPYLPSSRLIQKRFNGLEVLRKKLKFTDTHFGKGRHRSDIAHKVNVKGSKYERILEKFLHKKFGEVFVHSEKMLSDSKIRVDFYIYSPEGNFAIDIFHCETMRTLQSNVNIKVNKYKKHDAKIYLVSANSNITQNNLDQYVTAKINSLPVNIYLVSWDTFISTIKEMGVYKNPILK